MNPSHHIYGIVVIVICFYGVTNVVEGQVNVGLGRTFMTSCGNSSTLQDAYLYGASCQGIFTQWYRNNFPAYYWFNRGSSIMEYQNTSASWDLICRWGSNIANCYEGLLPQCGAGIGLELLTDARFFPYSFRQPEWEDRVEGVTSRVAFYRRTCDGTQVKQDIKQRIDDADFDTNTTCLNITHRVEINQCLRGLQEETKYIRWDQYQSSAALRLTVNRIAGATVNCVFSVINRSPCNQATKRVLYHVAKLQLPSFVDESELDIDETTTGDFSSEIRCTVGVYGDPHLKLCEDTTLVTCSAKGPQVYMHNNWFTIVGQNSDANIQRQTNPPITTLRSVQVTFHSFDTLDTVATYSASNGNLPLVFDNTNSTIQGQGNDEVVLTENYYGSQRRFIQASTGMVLTLRQWSGNYFFTLRVAQSVIKKSHGLLASGCPRNQIITRSNLFNRPAVRRKRATQAECEQACTVVEDPSLKETCTFDCYATDSIEFAVNMTTSAEEDIKEVVELDAELMSKAVTPIPTTKPTTAPTTEKTPSSASHSFTSYIVMSVALACHLFFRG